MKLIDGKILSNGPALNSPSPKLLLKTQSFSDKTFYLRPADLWQDERGPSRIQILVPWHDCLPQIPYWHLPIHCAYSELTGLEKTKTLFLLEPYLAAVLFSFSPNWQAYAYKRKTEQRKQEQWNGTLHIYLEPSGSFQHHCFFWSQSCTRKDCADSALRPQSLGCSQPGHGPPQPSLTHASPSTAVQESHLRSQRSSLNLGSLHSYLLHVISHPKSKRNEVSASWRCPSKPGNGHKQLHLRVIKLSQQRMTYKSIYLGDWKYSPGVYCH